MAGTRPTHVGEPPGGRGSINEASGDVYDLTAALDRAPPVSGPVSGEQGEEEVNLTSELDAMSRAESVPEPAATDPEPAPVPETESAPAPTPQPVYASARLDAVFGSLREQVATGGLDEDTAGEQFQLGLTYRQMGMLDEATEALEVAVRSPQFRFEAGLLLGRMCQEQGASEKAVS